jgi:multidrug efflux pump subunit AcrB
MKRIIRFFLENKRFNYTLLVFMILAGVYAYQAMPKEMFPPTTLDKILISGHYAGASAEVLDSIAVEPIEEEVSSISGIERLEATIRAGFFSIELTLQGGSDLSSVLSRVKDAVALARADLPSDMEEPVSQMMEAEIPLIIVNVSDEAGDRQLLMRAAEDLKRRLSRVENLTNITIYGQSDRQIRIALDGGRLQAYGLSTQAASQAIGQLSTIFPIGKIEEKGARHLFLSSYGGPKSVAALEETLITANDKRLYLGDIAEITIGYADSDTMASFNGRAALSVNVAKAKEGNAMDLAAQVRQIAGSLEADYPQLKVGTFTDTSVYIRNRLNTVTSSIFFGLILVSLVMLLLINKRISLVVTLGIPVAFVIALVFLHQMGETINMISLLGALIAIGVIVDDAIIVAENIQRHIEEGYPPKEAALLGAQEMVAPVIAASLTTVFAFLPMLMLTGEIGMFIKIIPIAISVLILAALIESFIFLPLHCQHLLSKNERELSWAPVTRAYGRVICFLVHYKKSTLAFFWLGVPALIVVGFSLMRFEFFPPFDSNQINITGKLPVNTSLEESYAVTQALQKAIEPYRETYHIETMTAISGFRRNPDGSSDGGENLFHLFVDLYPLAPQNFVDRFITPYFSLDYDGDNQIRQIQSPEIVRRLNEDLAGFKAAHNLEQLEVKGSGAGVVATDLEIAVVGDDDTLAREQVGRIRQALSEIEGVVRLYDDANEGIAELRLKLNDYGRQLGLSEESLWRVLSDYFLEPARGRALDEAGILEVVPVALNRDFFETLENFAFPLAGGQSVRLSEVVSFVEIENPEKVRKAGGQRRRTVYGDVDGITASEVIEQVRPLLEEIGTIPGISIALGGEQEKTDQLKTQMLMATGVAIFLIFLTLLVEFNAFRSTLMILSVIPLSLLGVILGHALMGLNLTMPSMIGALGLAGVAVNGGIVMLDFIRRSQTLGHLIERASLRVRPVVLTTLTTLAGLSLLVFFPSGQAVVLQPLAVSLGFGLFWATVLNLFYLPTFYALLNRIKDDRDD